jgi:regulator of protease activity HflC (stomatin/prohibitin superfamily)
VDFLLELLDRVSGALVKAAREHPFQTFVIALIVIRAFGSTVQTGWHGVLFRFGRARKALEPGFRWLIPGVDKVAKVRSRAITLDLAPQRVALADGLVFDVSANLVYRVRDPMAALIEIDDLTQGCETLAALVIYESLGPRAGTAVKDRQELDDDFTRRCQERLARWGLDVDRAGFTNLAPTPETIQVTQVGVRVRERAAATAALAGSGLSVGESLLLLGSDRRLVSHERSRFQRLSRFPRRAAARRERSRLSMEDKDEVESEINDLAGDDAADQIVARGRLEKRGPAALPQLRERLRRTGETDRRGRLRDAIRTIDQNRRAALAK